MEQEEKQILLIDLCGRLPYDVKVKCGSEIFTLNVNWLQTFQYHLDEIKLYLRPLSSMTEEEKTKLDKGYDTLFKNLENGMSGINADAEVTAFEADFYNSHHLDYRGLIEKGLALEAPEGMYKVNNI